MGWLNVSVIVYGLLMLFGGIMGFVTGKSTPSLIAGILSAMFLIGAAAMAKTNPRVGYSIAAVVTLILVGVFIKRYMDTQAPRNLGLVAVSVLMLGMLAVGHFMGGDKTAKDQGATPPDETAKP